MPKQKLILVEDRDRIRIVTFNRPKKLNALNEEVLKTLWNILQKTRSDSNIDVVIFTGAGNKAFIAGADIAQMAQFDYSEAKKFVTLGNKVVMDIEDLPQVTIAAVNGFALGGGTEVALACDFIYASEKAVFGLPEVGLGIIPGFGGTQRLMRKIPAGKAREMVFSGEKIDAQEAFRLGLVNRVLPPEKLMDETIKAAQKILANSWLAVRMAKKVMLKGADLPLHQACALELETFGQLFAQGHPQEGMKAFLKKRKPNFSR